MMGLGRRCRPINKELPHSGSLCCSASLHSAANKCAACGHVSQRLVQRRNKCQKSSSIDSNQQVKKESGVHRNRFKDGFYKAERLSSAHPANTPKPTAAKSIFYGEGQPPSHLASSMFLLSPVTTSFGQRPQEPNGRYEQQT